MPDRHIIYAVCQLSTDLGVMLVKRRVSKPLPWGEAIDRHTKLSDSVVRPSVKLRSTQVHFLAVRAADDPQWPRRDRKRLRLRDARSGRFV